MTSLANAEGKDGQGIAQEILKFLNRKSFNVPLVVPNNGHGGRQAQPTALPGQKKDETAMVKIYPNPTQQGFTFYYGYDDESEVLLEIKDLLGKIILSTFIQHSKEHTESYISLKDLSNGVYMVSVLKDKELLYSEKLIIQN